MEHEDRRPRIAASAYVAPNAVVSGDVTIGEGSRVLFGAVVAADGGGVDIGDRCVIMEHSLIRGRAGHRTQIGRHPRGRCVHRDGRLDLPGGSGRCSGRSSHPRRRPCELATSPGYHCSDWLARGRQSRAGSPSGVSRSNMGDPADPRLLRNGSGSPSRRNGWHAQARGDGTLLRAVRSASGRPDHRQRRRVTSRAVRPLAVRIEKRSAAGSLTRLPMGGARIHGPIF